MAQHVSQAIKFASGFADIKYKLRRATVFNGWISFEQSFFYV